MGDQAVPSLRTWPVLACGAVWVLIVAAAAAVVVLEDRLHDVGRGDLALSGVVLGVYAAAVMSAGVVGTGLAVRNAHPVGWAFVTLAGCLAAGVSLDLYARYGAVARPGGVPAADAVAHLLDPFFLAYFVAVAVALHLTPTGRPLTRRWGLVATVTVAAGAVGYVSGVFNDAPIDAPFEDVPNPLAVKGLGSVFNTLFHTGAAIAAVGLVIAATSLVVRFRRSTGADRQQLLWMTLAAAPLPLFVVIVFLFRDANNEVPLLLATGGFVFVVPVAAGLSISRYHLYDVDRILSRTFTYLLLSALVVLVYAAVVVGAGGLLSGSASSQVPAVVATLAAVTVAAPARHTIQGWLDRRFNRRRFDALAIVDRQLRDPASREAIDEVLRRAVGDPALRVAYWIDDRRRWVTADGRTAEMMERDVEISRGDVLVARVGFDSARTPRAVVEAAAAAALPELDNARLRAAISLQLVEVNESRARIATAQMEERRRIERNLHDGAQQRLLGLAFELRAAQMNGDADRLKIAVAEGVEQAQAALSELRDLANGLNPSVLADGGLAGALDDLVRRAPGVVARCTDRRFAPDVEATAWFFVCEAVANALKHAGGSTVTVDFTHDDAWLTVRVCDDGTGGAVSSGGGLQGLRDRAEAAGGSLDIESRTGEGTVVQARLPCAP